MKSIDKALGIHGKALPIWAKRMELLANNMSNVDTPGFKARDIDFKEVLKKTQREDALKPVGLEGTSNMHIAQSKSKQRMDLKYVTPSSPSLDGNTVDAHLTKTSYSENAVRYQITLSFLTGKIQGIMSAIKGE